MPRRRLTPEDREAWDRVRATARPLREPGAPDLDPAGPPRAPPADGPSVQASPPPPAALAALPRFRVGEAVDHRRSDNLLPGLVEGMGREGMRGAPPLRMDAKAFGRMARGKARPEARLDLHGLTLAEAHDALAGFILGSRAAGRRLVLVITGKGRGGEGRDAEGGPGSIRAGKLRHDVPRWLMLAPLAGAVLQIAPAHPRHGGEGALYIYLRAS